MNLVNGSVRDLIWQWAHSDLTSKRHADAYSFLNPDVLAKVLLDDSKALSDEDWILLSQALFHVRSTLLMGLLKVPVEWYRGTMHLDETLNATLLWPPFKKMSPSGTLQGLVEALDQGKIPDGEEEFTATYQADKAALKSLQFETSTILVAEAKEGPYYMLEGFARVGALASLYLAKQIPNQEFPVVLGVSTRLKNWYIHDSRDSTRLF